jgi:hypothetical protein
LEFLKGKEEQKALRALRRLIADSSDNDPPWWALAFFLAISSHKSVPRWLVFRGRRGRPDIDADMQLSSRVEDLVRSGWKVNLAVENVSKTCGLTRKAVYEARNRVKGILGHF